MAAALVLAGCDREDAASMQAAPADAPSSAEAPADGAAATTTDAALASAVAGAWRTPEFVARDAHRHPAETLAFFGIRPDMTVVEIKPGGGWYTEILAPYLRDGGRYVGAVVSPDSADDADARDYYARWRDGLRTRLASDAAVYGEGAIVEFDPAAPDFGAPGSADAVLTFRNVHNWLGNGSAPAMFKGFFDVLAPGGVLGVVEHRAAAGTPADDDSGYVAEQVVIDLAQGAGFVLEERSEVNANPADTKDHPNGVWTLPPTNRHEDADAARYRDIGESDRMTLRFRKPAT
ncbi:class I SAM-dependent methyltransferase [Luteimonas pelagia]